MREILFRGQTIYKSKGNAWYKGSLITESEGAKIVYDTTDENGWEYVIPETVGQYTGLDDKNGNKIFEGDVLKCNGDDDFCGQVEFINGSFCFATIIRNHTYHPALDVCDITKLEIIGNIHDNPKLRKGEAI